MNAKLSRIIYFQVYPEIFDALHSRNWSPTIHKKLLLETFAVSEV